MQKRLLKNRTLSIILCLMPVILYALFFEAIALNANYIAYDDIHVLQITDQWRQATTWPERLDWLTVGFPEHRIVFARLVVLLSYFLTGFVSLKSLMIISNFLWIAQLLVLFKILKRLTVYLKLPSYNALLLSYFVPICWILLCVHSFENIFWATSSLGNFGLLFFVMVAGYFYTHPNPKYVWLALVFSFLATFTYGNGLLTFLIGGGVLLVARRWKDARNTAILFAFTMALYSLTRVHASPSSLDLTNPYNYWHTFICFFAFIGSSVNLDVYAPTTFSMWASVIWGLGLFGFIFWSLLKHFLDSLHSGRPMSSFHSFLLFLFSFICLSALGVVYKRAESDGLIGMFKGRYRMYPTWAMICSYLLLLDWVKQLRIRWFGYLSIAASVLFNLLILFYAIAPAVNNRRAALAQEFNSIYNGDLIGLKMFDLTGSDFLRIQKLYQPNLFFKTDEKDIQLAYVSPKRDFSLDSVYLENDILYINYQKEYIRPSKDYDDGVYIVLKSPQRSYMSAGMQHALPLKTFIRRGWYWHKGFNARFSKASIMPGKYSIYVLKRHQGVNEIFDSKRTVIF